MYNRVSSWPAIGLICELYQCIGSSHVEDFPWHTLRNEPGPADRTLAHMLIATDASEAIPVLMQRIPEEHRSVSALLTAVKSAVATQSYHFYNLIQSTAHQLHCVFIAALIGFASSLQLVRTWKHFHGSTVHR